MIKQIKKSSLKKVAGVSTLEYTFVLVALICIITYVSINILPNTMNNTIKTLIWRIRCAWGIGSDCSSITPPGDTGGCDPTDYACCESLADGQCAHYEIADACTDICDGRPNWCVDVGGEEPVQHCGSCPYPCNKQCMRCPYLYGAGGCYPHDQIWQRFFNQCYHP